MGFTHLNPHPSCLDYGNLLAVQVGLIGGLFHKGVGMAAHKEVNAASGSAEHGIRGISGIVFRVTDMGKGNHVIYLGTDLVHILLDRRNHIERRDTVGNIASHHILKAAKDTHHANLLAGALQLAAQTVVGAARLLTASPLDPATLIKNVCSPGGSTIEGVKSLDGDDFEAVVAKAVGASYKRNIELGKA